jgi:hypothetical protein
MTTLGRKYWAIAEGFIPGESTGPAPLMTSHETVCILNTGDTDAKVEITIFFQDRRPVGPCPFVAPAQRTKHLLFNDFNDSAPLPRNTPYASTIVSDVPIVCQHTRLDSRQAENALMSTVAYAGTE